MRIIVSIFKGKWNCYIFQLQDFSLCAIFKEIAGNRILKITTKIYHFKHIYPIKSMEAFIYTSFFGDSCGTWRCRIIHNPCGFKKYNTRYKFLELKKIIQLHLLNYLNVPKTNRFTSDIKCILLWIDYWGSGYCIFHVFYTLRCSRERTGLFIGMHNNLKWMNICFIVCEKYSDSFHLFWVNNAFWILFWL